MRTVGALLVAIGVGLISPATFHARGSQPSPAMTVPRLISVSGVFHPADGQPPAAVEEITCAIYAEETGGTPLWQETQSIQLDGAGRYTVLLGTTSAEGIPLDVFASAETLWLGIVFARPGEVEGPRVRITSVPYALRASDAETLGGRPVSAYVLSPTAKSEVPRSTSTTSADEGVSVMTSPSVLPGTPNFLAKYVNGNDVGTSSIFELGGSVGIGTTSPFDTVHVRFNNSNGGTTGVALQNMGNTASSYSGLLFYDHDGFLGQFQGFNNGTHEYRINNVARDVMTTAFNGSINFMIGGFSRLFISSAQDPFGGQPIRVGIGTTSPEAFLDVRQDFSPNFYATAYSGLTPTFQGRAALGLPTSPFPASFLATFAGGGYATTRFAESTATFRMFAEEQWTDSAQGSAIAFDTTTNGTSFRQGQMSIRQSGFVHVGDVTIPSERLQVNGDIRVGTPGTNGCVKNFAGAGIIGTCPSDRRFKKDVMPFAPVLELVAGLQPVHYFWRAADFPERHFGDSRAYGLIAQEVEQLLPELVVTSDDAYKAVDYSKLPLLTVQTVKELKVKNEALKARIAHLERLMNELVVTPARR